ncbi:hypothetical protein KCP74_09850 [Salmonella enterica subsp. enterica]|nr:hypothetical protein KCP74_09850 [Salmonella enterica subsp. enterica]
MLLRTYLLIVRRNQSKAPLPLPDIGPFDRYMARHITKSNITGFAATQIRYFHELKQLKRIIGSAKADWAATAQFEERIASSTISSRNLRKIVY